MFEHNSLTEKRDVLVWKGHCAIISFPEASPLSLWFVFWRSNNEFSLLLSDYLKLSSYDCLPRFLLASSTLLSSTTSIRKWAIVHKRDELQYAGTLPLQRYAPVRLGVRGESIVLRSGYRSLFFIKIWTNKLVRHRLKIKQFPKNKKIFSKSSQKIKKIKKKVLRWQ